MRIIFLFKETWQKQLLVSTKNARTIIECVPNLYYLDGRYSNRKQATNTIYRYAVLGIDF